MNELGNLINKYRDLVIRVFRLGIDCCSDDCIIRVLDVSHLGNIGCGVYGLMLDSGQVNELLRRSSIIKLLLNKGIIRLFVYPCINSERINFLERLGFIVINYLTSDDCVLTREVIVHPDAYRIINLVRRGFAVYVHLYNPYIRRDYSYDAVSLFDAAFEYLVRNNVRVYLILDSI